MKATSCRIKHWANLTTSDFRGRGCWCQSVWHCISRTPAIMNLCNHFAHLFIIPFPHRNQNCHSSDNLALTLHYNLCATFCFQNMLFHGFCNCTPLIVPCIIACIYCGLCGSGKKGLSLLPMSQVLNGFLVLLKAILPIKWLKPEATGYQP